MQLNRCKKNNFGQQPSFGEKVFSASGKTRSCWLVLCCARAGIDLVTSDNKGIELVGEQLTRSENSDLWHVLFPDKLILAVDKFPWCEPAMATSGTRRTASQTTPDRNWQSNVLCRFGSRHCFRLSNVKPTIFGLSWALEASNPFFRFLFKEGFKS